ncbi:MAG TPA: class I SAM-dependent methyltransferase [Myxococcaceae bacterium]|jgi:caffeoyl-CoA O-methyltransferase|nr:class I SAM-dependent methyltransferase [Myxococcaceae bacterium]
MSMTLVPEAIEAYASEHCEPVPPLLEGLREETYAAMASPGMQVGRMEGHFLRLLVRLSGARRALEIGMFTGYSGLMIAEGLPEDGTLITCDVDPKAEAIARRAFARSPVGRKITIRMGPALETLKTLKGPLDFVFLDADKESYLAYFEAVLPLLRRGGLLVADNTLWSGKVLQPKSESDRAIVAFNDAVARDARVDKVLLTVRDGMTLCLKR